MSQENVEVVRRSFEAFNRGDYREALACFDAEVEYDLTHFPDGRVYHGHAGVREAFRTWLGTWEDYRQEQDEVIDAGDEVVVAVRESGSGKGSGARLERPTFGVWTIERGKVTRIRFYASREEALDAVGLAG
jgi:ketosteroid isomerase-like protein